MANSALAVLETALRERRLERTLTTSLPPLERSDPAALIPFDITAVDAMLRGGLPRGQLSELVGPHSSGRTTMLLHLLGAAARSGEIAALVETEDRLDVASAAAAGIDLDRLLWIRGEPGPIDRVVDRALKALNLVLQAGGFGVVAIDLADIAPRVLRSLPFTTWLRFQRIVEGSDTACVLTVPEPLARSAGGLTVMCTGRTTWSGASKETLSAAPARPRFTGLDTEIRVVSPRRRVDGEARFTVVANDLVEADLSAFAKATADPPKRGARRRAGPPSNDILTGCVIGSSATRACSCRRSVSER